MDSNGKANSGVMVNKRHAIARLTTWSCQMETGRGGWKRKAKRLVSDGRFWSGALTDIVPRDGNYCKLEKCPRRDAECVPVVLNVSLIDCLYWLEPLAQNLGLHAQAQPLAEDVAMRRAEPSPMGRRTWRSWRNEQQNRVRVGMRRCRRAVDGGYWIDRAASSDAAIHPFFNVLTKPHRALVLSLG